MYSNLQMARYFILAMLALIAIGLIVLFALKLSGNRKRKLAERTNAKYDDWFTYVLANLDGADKLHAPPTPPTPAESRFVQDRLLHWIERLKGVQQAKLIALCEEMGFAEAELARLGSPFEWVKLDAAHRLGCMRASRAVPGMLGLLKSVKGPLAFIVARAIAKSAGQLGELREMALTLLAYRTDSYELIADILLESELDSSRIVADFLQSEEEGKTLLALAAMRKRPPGDFTERLIGLTGSREKEVRLQAARLLTLEGAATPAERLERMLAHPDWEIRALAAEALGRSGRAESVAPLREALEDDEWHVRYNGAKSLAQYGKEGLAELYRTANAKNAGPSAEAAQAVIREQMAFPGGMK
ncbi:HEAT repeat domain-containing protein [Cohnella algarum]|uniref:HEAT repeat domain-containing protein n=1 Tax=Cohnella algarum TaxID=2044859 RepID=UPI00196805A0|nr:HEAT repeat domain-containing protein [Cohnella algarum]